MLRDSIQPFPTFSEVYIAALEDLHGQITTARGASEARGSLPAPVPSRRQDLLQPRPRPRKRRRQLTGGAQRVVANDLG
jgi:hypothetical protein